MNSSESADIKNQHKITNTIYYALILNLIVFFIVVMVIIQNRDVEAGSELDSIFTFVVPLIGFLVMLLSRAIYNRMISNLDSGSNTLNKIAHFRKAKIISWALIEGGCFFALVASIITSNYLYIAVFILLFGYFIMLRPSGESLKRDMRLNSEEIDLILRK